MRTTVDLPADILKSAQRVTGLKTKTATIIYSLRNIIKREKAIKLAKELCRNTSLKLTQSKLRRLRKNRSL